MIHVSKKSDGYIMKNSQIRWMKIVSVDEMEKIMKGLKELSMSMNPFIIGEEFDWRPLEEFTLGYSHNEIEEIARK